MALTGQISSRSSPFGRTSIRRSNALVSNTRPHLAPQLCSSAVLQSFARFNSSDSASHTIGEKLGEATGFIKPDIAEVLPDELPALTVPPNEVGYLADLGLNFGWGPTSLAQWLIESIHVYGGLPWWISIVAAGVFSRLAISKFTFISQDNAVRIKAIKPELDEARKAMMAAVAAKDQTKIAETRAAQVELMSTRGVTPFKSFYGLIQVPIGFGFWRFITNSTALPVPDWMTGGGLWFADITMGDPYHILPVAFAVASGGFFRLTASIGDSPFKPRTLAMFTYGIPVITTLFLWNASSALCLYFLATTLTSMGLQLLLLFPRTRRLAGVAPLPSKAGSAAPVAPPNVRISEEFRTLQQYRAGKPITPPKEEPKSALSSLVASAKSSYNETMSKAKEKMNERTVPPPGQRRSSAEQKAAERYEEKRRREEAERRRSERRRM